ncbi:stress response translation initiation inhibitor YciH [Candidatus Enterovibrio escicola]|uniref:stress response translation initiation inhibitor YciH n=1 Tax=Candidatus Enterovibrio escicola TaxID=1927127 RepID=UPI0012382459|nr:stress response translation initiation inhibitor YciH [Candidatus Enterovibrio escacola]
MYHDKKCIVFSTETEQIKKQKLGFQHEKGDGIIRIQRQTKGRKGKGVCVITGLDPNNTHLKLVAAELKKVCGCGGTVKGGVIEIQGDKRNQIKAYFEKKDYNVKFTGG